MCLRSFLSVNAKFYEEKLQKWQANLKSLKRCILVLAIILSFIRVNTGSTQGDWYYRKRGSASYIVREVLSVRERDTERERERRKWRHHCRAKIGNEFTLSLAKNSHFSFLPSHFPSLPSRRGHHCGAEIRNEFTLSIAKNVFALFVPPLSNGTSRATSYRKPKTNDQILPSPILFFIEKMNQINAKNYWK